MNKFNIPSPEQPSHSPSELTQAEMADLSAPKRNTVLYERSIEVLLSDVQHYRDVLKETQDERKALQKKLDDNVQNSTKIPVLKREKLEMFLTFCFVTFTMAIGSCLISSFPKTESHIPWQFGFGWALVLLGGVMTIFCKAVCSLCYRITGDPKY